MASRAKRVFHQHKFEEPERSGEQAGQRSSASEKRFKGSCSLKFSMACQEV